MTVPVLLGLRASTVGTLAPASGVPQPNQPEMNLLVHERDTIWGTIRSLWRGRHG
jgi:hypothetical protein